MTPQDQAYLQSAINALVIATQLEMQLLDRTVQEALASAAPSWAGAAGKFANVPLSELQEKLTEGYDIPMPATN